MAATPLVSLLLHAAAVTAAIAVCHVVVQGTTIPTFSTSTTAPISQHVSFTPLTGCITLLGFSCTLNARTLGKQTYTTTSSCFTLRRRLDLGFDAFPLSVGSITNTRFGCIYWPGKERQGLCEQLIELLGGRRGWLSFTFQYHFSTIVVVFALQPVSAPRPCCAILSR